MAYEDQPGVGEGDQGQPAPSPEGEGTWMLPADYEGADSLKVGDMLSFKVVAKNKDGTTELEEVKKAAGPKPLMQDFDETMAAPSAPNNG